MRYDKYSDEDLVEIYTTTHNYQGKIENDLGSEVEKRGGIDILKARLSIHKKYPKEIFRIKKEVVALLKKDLPIDQIKTSITSEILTSTEFSELLEQLIKQARFNIKDTAITARTWIGSIVGFLICTCIGSYIWYYSIKSTGTIYYILTPGLGIGFYLIIKLLTKQSKNNTLVFIATFTALFLSLLLGLWLCRQRE